MNNVNTSIRKLLKFPQYRLLYLGSTISLIGDLIFDVTVMIWITSFYAPQSAELALIATLAGACVMGPLVVVGPLAGVYVDRWNKKYVLLAANAIQAVFIAALVAVAIFADSIPPQVIVACGLGALLVTNVASQFIGPAKLVFTSEAVPNDFRTVATSLTMTTSMTLGVIAPPLSGPLYALTGVVTALAINVVSFLVSLWFLARLQPFGQAAAAGGRGFAGVWADLKGGASFAWSDQPLRAMLVLLFAMSIAVGALNSQMVLFTLEVLGWRREMLGVLFAIFGASAAVGSVVAPAIMKRVGQQRAFTFTLVSLAAGVGLMGLPTSTIVTSLAGVVCCGAGSGMLNVFFGPLIMNRVPREFMGRVASLLAPANGAGALLSMAAGGVFLTAAAGQQWRFAGVEFGRVHVLYLTCAGFFVVACLLFGRRVFADEPQPASASH